MSACISILLVFICRDKHPQGSQVAEYIFAEDQMEGLYVLVGFHYSLQKLEIQQSPSIHIFLTLDQKSPFCP